MTGLVQGVFFRVQAQVKANELKLTGWVKNLPNGGVEIHAEGSNDELAQLESWCHKGPEAARVDSVTAQDSSEEGCDSFQIVR